MKKYYKKEAYEKKGNHNAAITALLKEADAAIDDTAVAAVFTRKELTDYEGGEIEKYKEQRLKAKKIYEKEKHNM